MKAKHLLFSSVFLSMGFAACTNEVEEFAPQAQDKEFVGEELGKLTIDVTNSNFSADDAETRATLEKVGSKWIAKWGDNDAIGAAWFNRIKTNEGVVTHQTPIYDADFGYGSNAIFNWEEGNKFTCDAVCMAGAYVLYYPYNLNATDDLTAIKVKEIATPQTFKTSDVTEQVKENITAANVVSFRQGDDKLSPEFTVKQIPNLYALTFTIEDENLLKLGSTFKISRIYVEATNGALAAINTDGTVGPDYDMSTPEFDYIISNENWNNVDGEVLPQINFVGGENKVSRMQINVTNDNKETEKDYWITALGKTTGKFYFSMLPTEDFDKLTIKVVGKMGNATKIFKAEYDAGVTYFDALKTVMMSQGSALTLNVDLNIEVLDEGIYDVPQFVEAWKAGQREFELAEELDLTTITDKKVNFTDEKNGHIIFSGEKVTLPTIKGKYTFNNDVEIKGDATITRCLDDEHDGHVNTCGFGSNVTINGNLTTEGTHVVNIGKSGFKTIIGGNVNAGSPTAIAGAITIAGDVTVEESVKLDFANTPTIEGNVIVSGTLAGAGANMKQGLTVKETGSVSTKNINVTGDVTANGTFTVVNAGNATATIGGTLTANAAVSIDKAKVKDVTANAAVTIKEVIEMGNVTANAAVTIEGAVAKMGDVAANANVTVAGAVTAMGNLTTDNNAAVSFGDAVTEMGNITAAEGTTVTFKKAVKAANITTDVDLYFPAAATAKEITINKGTVTAKSTLTAKKIDVTNKSAELYVTSNLLVAEKLTANGLVNAKSYTKTGTSIGELEIADGIIVTLTNGKESNKSVIGKLTVNKYNTYFGTLNGDYIAVNGGTNEGTINVSNFTINEGTFAQKGTFTGAITVAEGATLNVDAKTAANVTNNGTVEVAANSTIEGEVVNNKTINLSGILDEAKGAITLNAGSVVKMAAKSSLTLTRSVVQPGEVNVCNGAILAYATNKKPSIVSYTWKTVAPQNGTTPIADIINKYYLDNATLIKNATFNTSAVIEAFGDITFSSDVDFTKNSIKFVDDTKFTATKAYKVTLSSTNTVVKEKTLTVEKVVLEGGKISLGTNAKFVGERGTTNVTY